MEKRQEFMAIIIPTIPGRLARRPRDSRGFPIPAVAFIKEDGTPDFRITDIVRWQSVVTRRACALCGEPLGSRIAFVGGPKCHEFRIFTDAGMHLECANFAKTVCPYLVLPKARHAPSVATPAGALLHISEEVPLEKPERFFIGVTRDYHPYRLPDGTFVVRAGPWESVEWFVPGEAKEKPAR